MYFQTYVHLLFLYISTTITGTYKCRYNNYIRKGKILQERLKIIKDIKNK
mgnify:CR=1 FL=1